MSFGAPAGVETLTIPHMLELIGVSHSGPIVPNKTSFWSKLTGSIASGLILKDISCEIPSGEVMAILGSKGSGKKTLIDVMGHRVNQGSTRGQILLNDVPLTLRLFQEQCGFVSKRTQLIDGLSVRQTLTYASHMTIRGKGALKRGRVKQVLADLALTSVAKRDVIELNVSEQKRLAIGLQIIRDPLLLILDDPTKNLDPLNTYFVVSILSNHAKKYQRIVILTMDKPRSDIFPFLDRVTYLCLGDVVYTGSTRMMMDYFRNIGFPCPELENPLMYYLCLSTVDRRSRDRFIESSAQIAALVDKFKVEGHEYRKYMATPLQSPVNIPLTAYGKASSCKVMTSLISRQFTSMFTMKKLFIRILVIPMFCALLYCFIAPVLDNTQNSLQSRTGLILNVLSAITFIGPAITAYNFASHRNRFYEESSRLALYRGPMFIITQIISNLPLTLLSVCLAATIVYLCTPLRYDDYWIERWSIFCAILWAIYSFTEHHTIAIMCFIKSPFMSTVTSIYLLCFYLVLGSTTLRSMLAAPDWLYYINFGNIYYWSSWTLHFNEFQYNEALVRTPFITDNSTMESCLANIIPGKCVFLSGNHFLDQRLRDVKDIQEWSIIHWKNFAFIYIFVIAMYLFNTIIYIVPLPASLKSKFRD
ncbi:ATP-binding cassette sub-family G member 5-like [Oppia nitens]|uniref:ATP-binding cassette sub-family G member 5-like n=1 Tax=Oppia nitens TaxID=1686743 RepID=UPI0023D9CDF0|nr:ATP-binding cassette sub-family G member 5-like [Oppia nitens]